MAEGKVADNLMNRSKNSPRRERQSYDCQRFQTDLPRMRSRRGIAENRQGIEPILQVVLAWATAQPEIRAVALVGSHARGTARPDSDIDLVLLATDPDAFRAGTTWVGQIDWHAIDTGALRWQDEEYGTAWSRRVCLTDRRVLVEFTFASLNWANTDLPDAGTRRVISGGCRILYDSDELLSRLCEAIGREN